MSAMNRCHQPMMSESRSPAAFSLGASCCAYALVLIQEKLV